MRSLNKISFICILLGIITYTSCKKNDDNLSSNKEINTVKDIDGNTYKTVTIGSQIWMAENLKVTKYNDGSSIPNITNNSDWKESTTAAYCWYNNEEAICKNKYGALYNFYAVESNKLCPEGWRVSTDDDWGSLKTFLSSNGYSYDGKSWSILDSSKIAKSIAMSDEWSISEVKGAPGNSDFNEYQNKSGFSAIPAGMRQGNINLKNNFTSIEYCAYWWSSTEYDDVWNISIRNSSAFIEEQPRNKSDGFSVRCIKD